MGESTVHAVQYVALLILCSVVVFAVLAKRLNTPYPIILMLAGLGLALVPGVPRAPLNPDLIFLVVLPPLLYSAAWHTSWREFKYNLSSILLLAVGLVFFTVFGVAFLGPKLLPGFDWNSAFVLGAVVATTDAIAATAIGRRLGLPPQILGVLEGESLVNDASGLLALEFGLAMLVDHESPTIGFAAYRLLYLVCVGIGIGLITGWIISKLEPYIDDGPVETGISLLIPYGLYVAAESIKASGVLAVVAAGLYLSRKSSSLFSPHVRLQLASVWETLEFLMNGFVFLLMGLQLPYVLQGIQGMSLRQELVYASLFSLILVGLRLVWAFPGAHLARLIRNAIHQQNYPFPPPKHIFVVGWTGMRGVVALAAGFSLPSTFADGQPFTARSSIIFLTFSVIFVTLVVQGLTLPPLIRSLHLSAPDPRDSEEEAARKIVLNSALEELARIRENEPEEFAAVYDDLERRYRLRLFAATGEITTLPGEPQAHIERFRFTSEKMRNRERQAAIELRDSQRISDELLDRMMYELDLVDSRVGLEGKRG